MKYYDRTILTKIIESLEIMPAIFLNDPRQVGSHSLIQRILQKKYISADYVTFDDITIFARASKDPVGFLRTFTRPVIIDEVQKVPQIFSSLKLLIDEYRLEYRLNDKSSANGRFILTGSVGIDELPDLTDALVGRMAIIAAVTPPPRTLDKYRREQVIIYEHTPTLLLGETIEPIPTSVIWIQPWEVGLGKGKGSDR